MSRKIQSMLMGVAALLAVTVPGLALAAPPPPAADTPPEQIALTPQWWQAMLGNLVSEDMLRMGLDLLLAVLMFIGGWLLAKLISWVTFKALCKTDLDNKLATKLGFHLLSDDKDAKDAKRDPNALERGVASVVFYLLMALVVVGVLDFAGLEQAAGPIQGLVDTVMQALPLVGKAILILAVATITGMILRKLVTKALDVAKVDKRFADLDAPEGGSESKDAPKPFSQTAGQVVFGLAMIFGLAGAFDALQIKAISEPMANAINTFLGLLPAIGIAALIGVAGWVLAKIVRSLTTRALESIGFDKLVAKVKLDGLFGDSTPSKVAGWLAMAFIVVQTAIAALDRLGLDTLSAPMTDMMGQFWALLPALLISALFVVFGVFVGRLLRGIAQKTLEGIGFDKLMDKLGFGKIAERDDELAKPSGLVGFVVQVIIVLLAIVQGFNNLGLQAWAGYVDAFLQFSVTRVAVALLIVGVGFTIGNYVRDLIEARQRGETEPAEGEGPSPVWMAEFARYAVLVFAFTMAVHQLGVAEDFVLMSFALLFGALCLAGALAFGLGARDLAGEIVRERYKKVKQDGAAAASKSGSLFSKPLK